MEIKGEKRENKKEEKKDSGGCFRNAQKGFLIEFIAEVNNLDDKEFWL